MKQIKLQDCLLVDFKNLKDEKCVVALHETGHFIVMYALGLMDLFKSIDIKERNGVLGLTDMQPDFQKETASYAARLAELAGKMFPFDSNVVNDFVKAQYVEGPALYLSHLCRLYAGGAICRHYGIDREDLCSIDMTYIKQILTQFGMADQVENLQTLVDAFLKNIFVYYDLLIKAIYTNLLTNEELKADEVKMIIEDWKQSTPILLAV